MPTDAFEDRLERNLLEIARAWTGRVRRIGPKIVWVAGVAIILGMLAVAGHAVGAQSRAIREGRSGSMPCRDGPLGESVVDLEHSAVQDLRRDLAAQTSTAETEAAYLDDDRRASFFGTAAGHLLCGPPQRWVFDR